MRLLEDSLAEEILSGRVQSGSKAVVDVDDDGKVTILPGENRELLPQGAES